MLPKLLKSQYIKKDNKRENTILIHRAILGSIERFIGILIEHYSGKFPFWISPLQTMVIPVSNDFNESQ